MAEPKNLDRTPDTPEPPPEGHHLPVAIILGRMAHGGGKTSPEAKEREKKAIETSDQPATREQFEELMEDRPEKFNTAQADFHREPTVEHHGGHHCGDCWHFYVGRTAKRSVCEVTRPDDEDGQVFDTNWCKFWSDDGENYPDLKEEKPASPKAQ